MSTAKKLEYPNRTIVYDMPSDEYHSLKRFSASGVKKILTSSQDFWVSSWMNPNKREYKSDAFNVGTAYHTCILEGVDVFNKRYAVKPDCDKRTKEGKEIYAAWMAEHPNAEPIDADLYTDILAAKANDLEEFRDGYPEVTVLWDDEETGVPMKSRIDYLKLGKINDLKTFSNSSGMDINRLLARHIVQYHYHIQMATYTEALPGHEFNFIFQQTGQVNNCIVKPFPSSLLLANKGQQLMRYGINKFANMYREFGDSPWYDNFSNESFKDEDFPLWVYE